ncbi:MAG: hypothetical protein VB137_11810 [Burkholderia sp.]
MLKKVDVQEVPLAATEGARSAAVDAACAAEFKRWSVGRKRAVVLRLLRGESIGAVSREVGVTIAGLEQRRELAPGRHRSRSEVASDRSVESQAQGSRASRRRTDHGGRMLRMERERQERRPLIVRSSST